MSPLPDDCPATKRPDHPISINSRVTLGLVVMTIPLIAWAARVDSRVENLERERIEIRAELRAISAKLDDIRERIPLMRAPLP